MLGVFSLGCWFDNLNGALDQIMTIVLTEWNYYRYEC